MPEMPEFVESLLEEMIEQQRNKVLTLARQINGCVTSEDIRNPQDIPDLYADPVFNYEDGILTGYLAIQSALRSLRNQFGWAKK